MYDFQCQSLRKPCFRTRRDAVQRVEGMKEKNRMSKQFIQASLIGGRVVLTEQDYEPIAPSLDECVLRVKRESVTPLSPCRGTSGSRQHSSLVHTASRSHSKVFLQLPQSIRVGQVSQGVCRGV